jgi:hypothetical protein
MLESVWSGKSCSLGQLLYFVIKKNMEVYGLIFIFSSLLILNSCYAQFDLGANDEVNIVPNEEGKIAGG